MPQGFVGFAEAAGYVDNSRFDAFPEIRSQGSLGSCTTFAITYYQLTYTAGRKYIWDNKNVNNDRKFSPKWTYNMVNNGADQGSSPGEVYAVHERHGAATWTQFPYVGSGTDAKNYRAWCLDSTTWRDAINYRIYPHLWCVPASRPPSPAHFDAWLARFKLMLTDGEVLTFPTYVINWQYTTIKDDKATLDDDAFVGKRVAYGVNGSQGGHMMTIVGYSDSIWSDINDNGVVDAGEKGALRIANSWGTGWEEGGFCWLAYDALREQSAVPGVPPSSTRTPGVLGYGVFSIAIRYNYAPSLLAVFTVSHARRDQLGITLAGSGGTPWKPGALQFQGGPYAFDGTTTACEGTFVFDFTEVLAEADASDLYELWVTDDDDLSNAGSLGRRDRRPAKLLSYGLIVPPNEPANGGTIDPPLQIDASVDRVSLYHPLYAGPVAVLSASSTSGRAPLTVYFDGSESSGPISRYVWDFGDGSPATAGPAAVSYVYRAVGTYDATLTVIDDSTGAESSDQVTITVTRGNKR